jgi:hypothetical protein
VVLCVECRSVVSHKSATPPNPGGVICSAQLIGALEIATASCVERSTFTIITTRGVSMRAHHGSNRLSELSAVRATYGFRPRDESHPARAAAWSKEVLAFNVQRLVALACDALSDFEDPDTGYGHGTGAPPGPSARAAFALLVALTEAGLVQWPGNREQSLREFSSFLASRINGSMPEVVHVATREPLAGWMSAMHEPSQRSRFFRRRASFPAQLLEKGAVEAYRLDRANRMKGPLPWVPRNAPILDTLSMRYAELGFRWQPIEEECRGRMRRSVRFWNRPRVGKIALTLADLMLIDDEDFGIVNGTRRNFELRLRVARRQAF